MRRTVDQVRLDISLKTLREYLFVDESFLRSPPEKVIAQSVTLRRAVGLRHDQEQEVGLVFFSAPTPPRGAPPTR